MTGLGIDLPAEPGREYVDAHSHFTTVPVAVKQWRQQQLTEFTENGRRLSADSLEVSDSELSESLRVGQLPLQAQHGIDAALLSPIAGLMGHHLGDQETSLEWTRLCNDIIHRATRAYPSNFVGVCQLPQSPKGSIDASVKELHRCVEELGFVGAVLNPDTSDGYWQAPPITDPYYYPLFEAMVELGVPALVHTSMSANSAVDGTCAHYLNGDTTVFMQLCNPSFFERFPELRLIIPHGGGAVPYHWGRYQGALYDRGQGDLVELISNNIYFDTCVYGQRGMQLLVDTVPAENLIFASEMIGAVRGVDPTTGRRYDDTRSLLDAVQGLNDSDRAAIASGNARRIFSRLNVALPEKQLPLRPGAETALSTSDSKRIKV